MRRTILASLLVSTLAPAVLAQTIGDAEYTAYQNQLAEDTASLLLLPEAINVVFSEYDSISEMSDYDRNVLRFAAGDALRTIDIMRIRGRAMFNKVEHNYEQHCLNDVPSSLPCDDYKETYLEMIVDTMVQGTLFYTTTQDSRQLLSVLNEF